MKTQAQYKSCQQMKDNNIPKLNYEGFLGYVLIDQLGMGYNISNIE